jgi:hypothetical protein
MYKSFLITQVLILVFSFSLKAQEKESFYTDLIVQSLNVLYSKDYDGNTIAKLTEEDVWNLQHLPKDNTDCLDYISVYFKMPGADDSAIYKAWICILPDVESGNLYAEIFDADLLSD